MSVSQLLCVLRQWLVQSYRHCQNMNRIIIPNGLSLQEANWSETVIYIQIPTKTPKDRYKIRFFFSWEEKNSRRDILWQIYFCAGCASRVVQQVTLENENTKFNIPVGNTACANFQLRYSPGTRCCVEKHRFLLGWKILSWTYFLFWCVGKGQKDPAEHQQTLERNTAARLNGYKLKFNFQAMDIKCIWKRKKAWSLEDLSSHHYRALLSCCRRILV